METKKLLFGMASVMALLCACENGSEISIQEELKTKPIIETKKLSFDTEKLSPSDAQTVAGLYNLRSITRSDETKTVKNVITINDKDGEPAIYAVNFNEDGYILISATTKYYPILATVDHGQYTEDMPATGQMIVIEEMLDDISRTKNDEEPSCTRALWNKYIDGGKIDAFSRASDNYQQAYNEWYNSQAYGDFRIIKLSKCSGSLPANVYSEFVAAARTEDLWEGTEYSWENTAYVVERTTDQAKTYGPFLTTTWGQDKQYNTSGHDRLGCVTVAVGQLMRFFRQPTSFDWNNMPDKLGEGQSAPALTNFLSQLRGELGVNEKGGANIGDASRVLKSYGYNITQSNHVESSVCTYLLNKRKPIYARGESNDAGGHAWIIDGVYQHVVNVSYTLYRLSDVWYPQFKYVKAEAASTYNNYSDFYSYHMNWGWNGDSNGWYIDSNSHPQGQPDSYNFKKYRKELYINNF